MMSAVLGRVVQHHVWRSVHLVHAARVCRPRLQCRRCLGGNAMLSQQTERSLNLDLCLFQWRSRSWSDRRRWGGVVTDWRVSWRWTKVNVVVVVVVEWRWRGHVISRSFTTTSLMLTSLLLLLLLLFVSVSVRLLVVSMQQVSVIIYLPLTFLSAISCSGRTSVNDVIVIIIIIISIWLGVVRSIMWCRYVTRLALLMLSSQNSQFHIIVAQSAFC